MGALVLEGATETIVALVAEVFMNTPTLAALDHLNGTLAGKACMWCDHPSDDLVPRKQRLGGLKRKR